MTNEEMIERFVQAFVLPNTLLPSTQDRARRVLSDMLTLVETRVMLRIKAGERL